MRPSASKGAPTILENVDIATETGTQQQLLPHAMVEETILSETAKV